MKTNQDTIATGQFKPSDKRGWTQKMASLYDFDLSAFKPNGHILFLLALSLVYVTPIILSDRYHIDDLGRSISGFTAWELVGRPLSNWILLLLNFQLPWSSANLPGQGLVDTGYLFQLLSALVLILVGYMYLLKLYDGRVDFFKTLTVFPLIASPFAIENFAYRFDSISMSLSIFCAMTAALHCKNRILDMCGGAALLACGLCLYQSSFNVFIAATTLLVFKELVSDRSGTKKLILHNIVKCGAAIALYLGVVLRWYPPKGGYADEHSELLSISVDSLDVVAQNLHRYYEIIFTDLGDFKLLYFGFAACIAMAFFDAVSRRHTLRQKVLIVFALMACIGSLTLSNVGILIFLKSPVFQARALIGYSIFLIFLMMCAEMSRKRLSVFAQTLLLIMTYKSLFVVYTYGAAARAQTIFDIQLATQIRSGLEASQFNPRQTLIISGIQPLSPTTQNSRKVHVIDYLVQRHIDNNWYWGYVFLYQQGLRFTPPAPQLNVNAIIREACSASPVHSAQSFNIYKYENSYVAAFEEGGCKSSYYKRSH